jgi:hypothetical protein
MRLLPIRTITDSIPFDVNREEQQVHQLHLIFPSPLDDSLPEVGFSLNYLACPYRATNRAVCVPGACQSDRPCLAEVCALQDLVDRVGFGRIDTC